ncbi:MAG: ExeA family protein [Thermodesulfobacteriota bacterium]
MYQEYFGLKENPFSLTPDPQYFYLSASHLTAVESLLFGIQRKMGFMVVTGDIGTGKTTLCRVLLERLAGEKIKTALLFNPFLAEEELWATILKDFGLPSQNLSRKEMIDSLYEFLLALHSRGENAVLIIDEAQNLSIPVLEQIRLLSNLETAKEKILQIILFGQLELTEKLNSPDLRQLNQRLAIRLQLYPLYYKEMENYIYQRLIIAGGRGNIFFSKSALRELYRFSKGVPRLINLLCDRALLAAFVAQTNHIDRAMVQRGAKNLWGEARQKRIWERRPYTIWIIFLFLLGGLIMGSAFFPPWKNLVNLFIEKIAPYQSEIKNISYPGI